MTFNVLGNGALDYFPCRYGNSKLLFRGPKRKLGRDYVAFLGGTETYGKFISTPYPDLIERSTGKTCVNFGCLNAGVDAFLNDPPIFDVISGARVTVVQVVGAQNMSNRFYSVHPRRNDRFLKASPLMQTVFREVDFTEFHFNRHMLQAIKDLSPERYEMIRSELKSAWLARMRLLLHRIRSKTVLLWFADHAPSETSECNGLGLDPLFIDRAMMNELSKYVTEVVEVETSASAITGRTEGMIFNEMEAPAAAEMMGPIAHAEAAEALEKTLLRML